MNFSVNRAAAYYERGELENAIADYDRALGLDPADSLAHYGLGTAYNEKGDRERR